MPAKNLLLFLAATVLTLTFSSVQAGGSQDVGEYVIHYNALSTADLSPNVASAYGIVRSANRALLNVSVTRKENGSTGEPVAARVDVNASNLSGQVKSTRLRKVEGDGQPKAVYYIAEINVADGETLVFDVRVRPQDHDRSYTVRFKQQFFAD